MLGEGTKAKIRRIVEEAYNQGSLETLRELYAADLLYHRPPLPDIEGLAEFRQHIAGLRSAFSDTQFTISRIILEGDAQAYSWSFQGTHTGRSPSIPVPPTGRKVTMMGCSVSRRAEGQIIEEWNYIDWLGLFRQVGVIPPMG